MLTSYAACTTDVRALQRHLNMLTYHKGLQCSFWNDALHSLAHMQMLEMTLFKPSFVDAVLPFILFAYQPWPSLPSQCCCQSLSPSLTVPTSKASLPYQPQAGKGTFTALSKLDPIFPKQLFAFTELQALLHCVNQPKECFPFKSNYLP